MERALKRAALKCHVAPALLLLRLLGQLVLPEEAPRGGNLVSRSHGDDARVSNSNKTDSVLSTVLSCLGSLVSACGKLYFPRLLRCTWRSSRPRSRNKQPTKSDHVGETWSAAGIQFSASPTMCRTRCCCMRQEAGRDRFRFSGTLSTDDASDCIFSHQNFKLATCTDYGSAIHGGMHVGWPGPRAGGVS